MMKLAVLAAVAGTAAAFAPSPVGVVRTHLNADVAADAEEVVEEPPAPVMSQALPFLEYPPNLAGYTGDVGFDPFRFSDFAPMDFLREAEIKHGRIAMMAWLGFCAVDCGFHIFPFPEAYEGLTSVTAHDALVEQGALSQMFLWFGLLEIIDGVAIMQMLEGSGRQPGDFGLDPAGFLKGASDEAIEDMKLKEITHCRLGMLAFSGVVTQAVLTQGPFPYV
jgi:light-harvesting complex I chlorophyll a/b binding protein 1